MTATVGSVAELQEALGTARDDRRPVRLHGSGSTAPLLPAPPDGTLVVSTAPMNRILRLDPADLTCSVEPGLPRSELDAALDEHGLCLPCPGGGTLGGLLAADRLGALGPRSPGARHVLLGLEGVLAEGLAFKSGAKVVKSVAGFDLHKVFVGSCGRLFAATTLHLRLRPRPADRAGFRQERLNLEEGQRRFRALRTAAEPPAVLALRREPEGVTLLGCWEDRPRAVRRNLAAHGLMATEPPAPGDYAPPAPGPDRPTLLGTVRPSRWRALVAELPSSTTWCQTGGGRIWATDGRAELKALAAAVVEAGGSARLAPSPPSFTALELRLRRALDPHEVLV